MKLQAFERQLPMSQAHNLAGRGSAPVGRHRYLWPNEKFLFDGDGANPGTEVTDHLDAFVDGSDRGRTWLTY